MHPQDDRSELRRQYEAQVTEAQHKSKQDIRDERAVWSTKIDKQRQEWALEKADLQYQHHEEANKLNAIIKGYERKVNRVLLVVAASVFGSLICGTNKLT